MLLTGTNGFFPLSATFYQSTFFRHRSDVETINSTKTRFRLFPLIFVYIANRIRC